MPSYEQIIEQSQENINLLSQKLLELEVLHNNIKLLIKQPEEMGAHFHALEEKYLKIVGLTSAFSTELHDSTKVYLEESNKIFKENINKFETQYNQLGLEINRLNEIDLKSSFESLQIEFINRTRDDLQVELQKIDDKTLVFHNKIEDFQTEITRLASFDLKEHFDLHQKTLSDIFGAVNNLNLTMSKLTTSFNEFNYVLTSLKNVVENKHQELRDKLKHIEEFFSTELNSQGTKLTTLTRQWEEWSKAKDKEMNQLSKNITLVKNLIIGGITFVIMYLFFRGIR
jgi:hypothetical protein